MRVEARKTDGHLVYFTCPACEGDIYGGFSRLSGPVKHHHYRRDTTLHPCRLIVVPDPVGGAHEIIEVPETDDMDAYLKRELARFDTALRQSQAWTYRAGELGEAS